MKTAWVTYQHASGNMTTQPVQYFEPGDGSVQDYCEWLIESGEALKITSRPDFK